MSHWYDIASSAFGGLAIGNLMCGFYEASTACALVSMALKMHANSEERHEQSRKAR